MNHATITPTDNGPYLVQGIVTLLDAEGNAHEVTDTIALCRCGLSATKPYCDGSHEKTYFKARQSGSIETFNAKLADTLQASGLPGAQNPRRVTPDWHARASSHLSSGDLQWGE